MERVVAKERMDDPRADVRDLELSLRFIRWVNEKLGGTEAALKPLRAWAPAWPRRTPITILDVGTGSADIPVAIKRWAMAAGHDVRVTGLEKHPKTLQIARRHVGGIEGVTLLQGDALELADRFAPASFDYVHAGMFLHHLQDKDVERVLSMMDRVAKRGIIWNDLLRSPFALRAVKVLTLFKSAIVKHDAVASVRAGFTRAEVEALVARAGIGYASYEERGLTQRFTLAGEKPPRETPEPAPAIPAFRPVVHIVGPRTRASR